MPELIAVDATALQQVLDRLDDLSRKLDAVQVTPVPRTISLDEYAAKVGRSKATVRRWIREGKIEVFGIPGSAPMLPNPDA